MAGRMINGAAALAELIRPASDTGGFGTQRVLPVLPELSNLLPSRGLRRGSTIAIGITPGASVHQGALPTPASTSASTSALAPAALPVDGARDLGGSGLGARRDSSRSASAALPVDGVRDLGGSGLGARRDSSRSALVADVEAAKGPSGRSLAPAGRPSSDSYGAGSSDGASASGGAVPRTSGGGGRIQDPRGGGPAGDDAVVSGSADSTPPARSLSLAEGNSLAEGSSRTGGISFGEARSSALRGALPGAGHVAARGASLTGSGSTSLLLALLAAASSAGSWCAVVGVPTLGALAAAESGIALDRLALVPDPGPEWPTVVAALIDGVDVVVIAVPGQVSPSITSRLVARARQRGCVLVPYGRWDGADVTLQVTQGHWEGLGEGHGRLRRRKVTVVARGRGTAARPKEITMWMPGLSVAPPHDPAAGTRSRPTAVPSPAATAAETAPSSTPATRASTGSAPLASVTPILSAASASPPAAGSDPATSRRLANGEWLAGVGWA